MKVIRLTYRDTEVNPSVYLLLYFRLAGIYVYERFWGEKVIQLEEPESSEEKQDMDQHPAVFSAYDCDIYIVKDARDLQEYNVLPDKRPERTVLLSRKQIAAEGAVKYGDIPERLLVLQINQRLLQQGIIATDEKSELDQLAKIYDDGKLMKLTLKEKYFFTVDLDFKLTQLQKNFNDIIERLLRFLAGGGCAWGDNRFIHAQYAVLNMIYELNCICNRHQVNLPYSKESLLKVCDTLETGIDGRLGDSVRMLQGQVYDDLCENPNAAYEKYISCCSPEKSYNSYVYFRKGNYWQDFGEDWEQALKYYRQAVRIYPEYYRAWFKIGLCSRKLGRNREAAAAYENVRRCLSGRINGKCVRPMEIEHVFKAQIQLAEIWEENGSLNNAVSALLWAERVWNLIDETGFYDLMSEDSEDAAFYREKTKENIAIEDVYERMIILNTVIGNKEEVQRCRDKLG